AKIVPVIAIPKTSIKTSAIVIVFLILIPLQLSFMSQASSEIHYVYKKGFDCEQSLGFRVSKLEAL
ncbi:MAG: hypothetical protein R2883_07750, partial [Caldisericia bacterium]